MFGCKAAAGGQLLTCWHKTEKGNRAVRPCPGGAAHARGGREKNWCLDCAGPRLRLSYSTARAPGAGAAQCVQPRWDAGTGCRKNGELETRGKWELPERSGARAARAGARPLEGEGWQKLLKGLGPGGAPKGQEGGAVLAARATRRSRSLSPALLPLRLRRRTGAGAVGQGGCGQCAFPAGSGTRRCDRGRAAGGGGGRRCSGRWGDRLRGSSEGERSRGRQSPWSELAELETAGVAGFRSLSPLVRQGDRLPGGLAS